MCNKELEKYRYHTHVAISLSASLTSTLFVLQVLRILWSASILIIHDSDIQLEAHLHLTNHSPNAV